MGDRIILHCDLNCFFASVELLDKPALQNVPVAVCGDPASRHGIILAKNEAAKRMGVQTAETVWQAKQKCPHLILLPPHHSLYADYSRRVNTIYGQYTDLVEPFGIDESWLDVTGSLHLFGGDARQLADDIRARLRQELRLTISVGVSFNKVFAKLGSDYKKPDATTVISRENWRDMVWPLPVGDLLFVGRAARRTLSQFGVETIGQLAACKPELLEQPSVIVADIGGWTVDLMEVDNQVPNAATCRSLELGVIRCLNEISEQLRRTLGLSLTNAQIESVLRGVPSSLSTACPASAKMLEKPLPIHGSPLLPLKSNSTRNHSVRPNNPSLKKNNGKHRQTTPYSTVRTAAR